VSHPLPEPRLTTASPEREPLSVRLDLELIQRAQRGEPEAFDRLYHEHVGRVYAICLRMCADAVRARELTQDVFVRAWQKLGSFRGESLLSTWLHRLAVNVVIEAQRGAGRGARGLEVAGGVDALERAAPEVPSGERLDLERAIAALPPGARGMLVLHAIEGYRYEEIAEMTGVAVGTVKAQIHRARRLLREALE
jgi:RNA polymerase sigma-70 factor (ECF subfamily)